MISEFRGKYQFRLALLAEEADRKCVTFIAIDWDLTVEGGLDTGKSVVLESQKRAGQEGSSPLEVPSPPAPASPAIPKPTFALHSALENALLHCTMERYCSSRLPEALQLPAGGVQGLRTRTR